MILRETHVDVRVRVASMTILQALPGTDKKWVCPKMC